MMADDDRVASVWAGGVLASLGRSNGHQRHKREQRGWHRTHSAWSVLIRLETVKCDHSASSWWWSDHGGAGVVTGHWCQCIVSSVTWWHGEAVSEQRAASLKIMLDPLSCVKKLVTAISSLRSRAVLGPPYYQIITQIHKIMTKYWITSKLSSQSLLFI